MQSLWSFMFKDCTHCATEEENILKQLQLQLSYKRQCKDFFFQYNKVFHNIDMKTNTLLFTPAKLNLVQIQAKTAADFIKSSHK